MNDGITHTDLDLLRSEVAATYATKQELDEVYEKATTVEKVIVSLETRLDAIGESLQKLEGNISWGVKAVIGLVIAALVTLVFK